MALDGTVAGLKASIADWLNRDDLTAVIPDFIALCEAQLNRLLTTRRMQQRSDATLTAGTEYLALPADFSGMEELNIKSTNPTVRLRYVSPDNLERLKGDLTFSGDSDPLYYTVIGSSFRFLPVPANTVTLEIVEHISLTPLSSGTANWVLTIHPDAYLFGSLLQATPYLKDDQRAGLWGQAFAKIVDDINANEEMPTENAPLRTEISRGMLGVRSTNFDINTGI